MELFKQLTPITFNELWCHVNNTIFTSATKTHNVSAWLLKLLNINNTPDIQCTSKYLNHFYLWKFHASIHMLYLCIVRIRLVGIKRNFLIQSITSLCSIEFQLPEKSGKVMERSELERSGKSQRILLGVRNIWRLIVDVKSKDFSEMLQYFDSWKIKY